MIPFIKFHILYMQMTTYTFILILIQTILTMQLSFPIVKNFTNSIIIIWIGI